MNQIQPAESERRVRPVNWALLILLVLGLLLGKLGVDAYFDKRVDDADDRLRDISISMCVQEGRGTAEWCAAQWDR